jgi:hypothetical protein
LEESVKKASLVLGSLTLLAAAISTAHAVQLIDVQSDVDAVQQDIHFMDGKGSLVRGKRCNVQDPSIEEQARVQAEIDKRLLDPSFMINAKAGNVVNIAWHITTYGGQGNVTDAQIASQLQVLNNAYAGTGFSFATASIDRVSNRTYFNQCYGAGEKKMKQALAIAPATTLNIYTCNPSQGILGMPPSRAATPSRVPCTASCCCTRPCRAVRLRRTTSVIPRPMKLATTLACTIPSRAVAPVAIPLPIPHPSPALPSVARPDAIAAPAAVSTRSPTSWTTPTTHA